MDRSFPNTVKSAEKWKCLKFTWKLEMPLAVNQLVFNTISFRAEENVARLGFKLAGTDYQNSALTACVYFFSQSFHKLGLQVREVECSTVPNPNTSQFCQLTQMDDNKHLQMFHSTVLVPRENNDVAQPITLHFRVYVTGFIKTYQYQGGDNRLPVELWTSLLDGQSGADVELVIGSRVQSAHQAILAARSPVFMKMFYTESFRQSGNRVVIEDLSWDDFHYLLYFIYTGKLKVACNRALKQAAEKYQIQTLLDICNAAEQEPVIEEIFNFKLSHSFRERFPLKFLRSDM